MMYLFILIFFYHLVIVIVIIIITACRVKKVVILSCFTESEALNVYPPLAASGKDAETGGHSSFQRSSGQCRVVVTATWKTQGVAKEPLHGSVGQRRGLQ